MNVSGNDRRGLSAIDPALKRCIRPTLSSRRKRITEDLDVLQRFLEALAVEIYARDFDHLPCPSA